MPKTSVQNKVVAQATTYVVELLIKNLVKMWEFRRKILYFFCRSKDPYIFLGLIAVCRLICYQ